MINALDLRDNGRGTSLALDARLGSILMRTPGKRMIQIVLHYMRRRIPCESNGSQGNTVDDPEVVVQTISEDGPYSPPKGMRHRERAEKYLAANSLGSRSPVHAIVIRDLEQRGATRHHAAIRVATHP